MANMENMESENPFSEPSMGPPTIEPTKEERTLGMACHLLTLTGFVIPFGNFIGPLVLWLMKKDESPFVDDQGKESINFQITVTIASFICIPLVCLAGIGIVLMIVVLVYEIVYIIIAAMQANEGVLYRYPICWRVIQ